MTTGLVLTLVPIAALVVAVLVWLIPNRRADLAQIAIVQRRRDEDRTREVAALDAEISRLALRRDRLTGERQ